jgi:hypothetical protein
MTAQACFDCLSIGVKLHKTLGSVVESEFHLFSYLACLLSLYKGQPVSDWGYRHSNTSHNAPFSYEITEAVAFLIQSGLFKANEAKQFQMTAQAIEKFKEYKEMGMMSQRELFIAGACNSVLVLPMGLVREALRHEPDLERALKLSSTRFLLEDAGLDILYDHFSALSETIGIKINDLMTPAVIWLSYLIREAELEIVS